MAAATAPPPAKGASSSPPGARPAPGGSSSLTKTWNGLPVWAWVGLGGLSVAGLYVFVRGWRARSAATASTTSSTGATAGNTALPAFTLPGGGGGGTVGGGGGGPVLSPEPTTPGTVVTAPTPLPVTVPSPPVVPAGTIGHVYSIQDVMDIFARYGLRSAAQIQSATQGPSTESAQERIARILRDLNNGTRSLADVTNSISMLPGTPGHPIVNPVGGPNLGTTNVPSFPALTAGVEAPNNAPSPAAQALIDQWRSLAPAGTNPGFNPFG